MNTRTIEAYKPVYMKAIVIDNINGTAVGRGPYHNVKNASYSIRNFMRTMKQKFPGATHVNFYYKGAFQFQERYQVEQQEVIKVKPHQRLYNCFYQVTGEPFIFNTIILNQWDI